MKKIIKRSNRKNTKKYYDWNWILSKDRFISVVMGIRGGGKTYGLTKKTIEWFIKNGEKTIWLRRYATEIDIVFLQKFFNDMILNNVFPNYEFKTQKTAIDGIAYGYIREKGKDYKWKEFIIFMPLSIALKHKSVSMQDYNWLIFDEIFIDNVNSNIRYINGWNEPMLFYEFVESIARTRDNIRIIFVANAISSVNPYFSTWKVQLTSDIEWYIDDFICVHNYKNEIFKEDKLRSKWGQFINGTKYGDYNMDNEFLIDDDGFIGKKGNGSKWLFNLSYLNETYGLWSDKSKGNIYISKDIQTNGQTYCFLKEDMKPNYIMIHSAKYNGGLISRLIKEAFRKGYLYFESQEIKFKMLELIGILKG